ncbi:hypothetical protein GCM10025872_38180 [Barrientosiimonas endolithica]|uniref:Uncharacterized protein n=1 Tax=Barrientosiimonas endolithica TaxID=1535208 RepID=A0ABN6YTK3_9MICO|nr:hypothetical protein GCM10025872_38180 [Barrientosiimonas endolithica]
MPDADLLDGDHPVGHDPRSRSSTGAGSNVTARSRRYPSGASGSSVIVTAPLEQIANPVVRPSCSAMGNVPMTVRPVDRTTW